MPALNSSTIAGMEVVASRFYTRLAIFARVYATTTFLSRQCDDDCRTSPRDCAGDIHGEPSAVSGWLWREIATHQEYNRRRIINSTEKASAAIITDASLHGWGAVFIPQSVEVKIAGGKWEKKPFLIMQAEARAVCLALSAFSAILPSTMDVWVDNTSLQGAANKGSSKSHAMTWELQRICLLTLAECGQLLPTCGRQTTPQTHITRSVFTLRKLRRGSAGLVAGGPQVCHFVSNNMLILTEDKDHAGGPRNSINIE
ncbi:putative target of rapamycin (TOR) kinase 1 [Trypanosoma cruzi]|nr:putative target of rapamycin (TOR) kinase 1 [Trypanosoma cruzi]